MKKSKLNPIYVKILITIRGDHMFDYAKKIREYRERTFLTQEELAKILNVSYVSVCRWETGRFEPTMDTKKKLVALFNEIGMKLDD